jgi:3-deoxy-manno-octulosonate cytidylyltransferase (CMP-KDO synthetase)
MKKISIVIPSHLHAKRLPNKPLLLIDQEPMIVHVWRQAKKSKISDILVATADREIIQAVEAVGGKAILTSKEHTNGSDRIFEAVESFNPKPDIIINLQGDMPLINPDAINFLADYMQNNNAEMATLASQLTAEDMDNPNVVKVQTSGNISSLQFHDAIDFYRKQNEERNNVYHHVGIYAYQYNTLKQYVHLQKTKNELERSLEQMRALDNHIKIQVGFISDYPLGVDTQEDLDKIRLIYNDK